MPFGSFLDTLPAALFIGAHLLFLLVGLWAVRRVNGARYAPALWLYAASQIVFLVFFGGVITMKMAVLVEQTLVVIMVVLVASSTVSARA